MDAWSENQVVAAAMEESRLDMAASVDNAAVVCRKDVEQGSSREKQHLS